MERPVYLKAGAGQPPAPPRAADRARLLGRLRALPAVDLLVIGGGATGLGVALDACLRGLSVVLLESHDFAGGTSSRATKLVHGGVRYLAQGNIALVREALQERRALLHNAPHLAQSLAFITPGYRAWEAPFYGLGLKIYEALAGSASLGPTRWLNREQTLQGLPGVRAEGLRGGVQYWDGQFDDARLALSLARSAASQGALLLNYCPVDRLLHERGKVVGVHWSDARGSGAQGILRARCVVNATGVWVDAIRRMDDQGQGRAPGSLVMPSQGVHIVVDRAFMSGDRALLVPRTRDGRVLFAVPWLGHLILGTTDTPRPDHPREPLPFEHEIDFILTEAGRVLDRGPTRADIRSIWVGLRPLVRPDHAEQATQRLSREHTLLISPAGLVTVTGGKWTTYRAMAEDVLDRCGQAAFFDHLAPCGTRDFPLVGAPRRGHASTSLTEAPGLHLYGSEGEFVQALPGANHMLGLGLSEAMVRFAARFEYACTIEDVLARRHRMLFLDATLAYLTAPRVAEILYNETGKDPQVDSFQVLARQYGARVPS